MKPIPYGKQHITDDDLKAVTDTLQSDFLTQGPQIALFERAFAEYTGATYAVAVANGTAALHLCAIAVDVNEGTRVITTLITFVASANCIRYCGCQVSFCDIDPSSILMDVEKLRKLLKQSPKGTYHGLIPVDFAGHPINLEEYRALADEFGLWIIEDACHAPGAFFSTKTGKEEFCGNGTYADR